MTATPKNPPSAAQVARHAKILEETKRLMGEIGADQMTVRDLAAASGVAPGTIFNRFGSKDQVISMAVLDHFETVIRVRINNYESVKTPLEKLMLGLNLIATAAMNTPAFTSAMMSAYFKVHTDQRKLQSLYQALYDTWFPIVLEMQEANLLRPWVLVTALCSDLCDREFGVVMKWVQGDISTSHFKDRTRYSVLCILLGASRGRQATAIEQLLEGIVKRIGKSYA